MHAMLIYDVTQVLDLAHAKGAFLHDGTQFLFPNGLKDMSNLLQVFFPTLAEVEDVIQTNHHEWVG